MIKTIDKTFTVLLPLYQRDDLFLNFTKVLQSIYDNSVLPDDLIILLDGKMKNDFYNLIKLEKRKYNFKIIDSDKVGLAQILNIGINKVKTAWIARMDGDDLCELDRFENSLKFMDLNYDLFGGQIKEIDGTSKKVRFKKVPCDSKDIIKQIKYKNPFNHMTVFYKTDFAKKIGGYPDLYLKEDYAFWCKFIHYGAKVGNMDKIVATVNTDGMHTRRGGIKYILSEVKLQKTLLKYNLTNIISAFYICCLRVLLLSLDSRLKKILYNTFLRKKK